MHRLASFTALGIVALVFAGCPIYGDDHDDYSCGDVPCPPDYYCYGPNDCNAGETCGDDNLCHVGGCERWGCAYGFECVSIAVDAFKCVPESSAGGGGAGGGGGGDVVWCGNPDDCQAGETCGENGTCQAGDCSEIACIYGFTCDEGADPPACVRLNPAGCGEDADCAEVGAGFKCLSGVCTAPADQCFDGTQCPSGDVCADGKCTPSCADGAVCPSSYTCDLVELCTVPAEACAITNDCGGPTEVCVAGACVPRSIDGLCDTGLVWVDNGCIPDQSPIFVCNGDGTQDLCALGSICLHHSCYISCAPPNENACTTIPEFDQCKDVTTATGTHPVCGSNENLGNECDPTAGMLCTPGLVCIDGYCN
jgi:hypothetical protein